MHIKLTFRVSWPAPFCWRAFLRSPRCWLRFLRFRGNPAPAVEGIDFEPMPAIYVVAPRGTVKEASLVIVNRNRIR